MKWFESLFTKTERKLVYSTYCDVVSKRVKNRLNSEGISYVLKQVRTNNYHDPRVPAESPVLYNFFVKTEDESRALKAIKTMEVIGHV